MDAELGEARSQLAASEDKRRTLEAEVKQKVEEKEELERKLHEAEQRLIETRNDGQNSKDLLEKQLADLKITKTETDRKNQEKDEKIKSLQSDLKSASGKSTQLESQQSTIKNELRLEKEKIESMRNELHVKENENQNLSVQLQAAMRDLTLESENRSKTEESRRVAEMRIEELLASLEEIQITNEEEKHREREKNEDLWKQRVSYFYVAAISACATATIVSMVFRNYSKS